MCVAWQDEAPNADVARGDDVPIESPMPARPTKRRLTAPRPDAAAHVNVGATRNPSQCQTQLLDSPALTHLKLVTYHWATKQSLKYAVQLVFTHACGTLRSVLCRFIFIMMFEREKTERDKKNTQCHPRDNIQKCHEWLLFSINEFRCECNAEAPEEERALRERWAPNSPGLRAAAEWREQLDGSFRRADLQLPYLRKEAARPGQEPDAIAAHRADSPHGEHMQPSSA